MKNISIWKDTIERLEYPSLDEDKTVDVLIIGGGLTGVSTLYNLGNSNLKVMLVEQNKIGMSTTGGSTGKLTYLQNDLIDSIRKKHSDEIALKYIKAEMTTIEKEVEVIKKESIDCDLKEVNSYIYTNQEDEIDKLKDLEKFLNDNNIKTYKNKLEIIKSKYMFYVKNTYIFHPIKFLYGLLKNNKYPIYENTSIKEIKKEDDYYICLTDKFKIKAKYVVIVSHYPYFLLPYMFILKGHLEKSYLSASKYSGSDISLISYSNPFISMRTYKDYLIYLSNSHSINKSVDDSYHFEELKKKIKDLNLKPNYLWSNIDIMTNDSLPYIGEIKNNMLIGTGYNAWGLTNSFLAGIILSDIILGKKNEYIKLFDPKRFNMSQVLGTFSDTFKNIGGYISGIKSDTLYKCSHLGCNLLYNEIEKTYDCPCHGSRFDEKGRVISSPANKNINIEND